MSSARARQKRTSSQCDTFVETKKFAGAFIVLDIFFAQLSVVHICGFPAYDLQEGKPGRTATGETQHRAILLGRGNLGRV